MKPRREIYGVMGEFQSSEELPPFTSIHRMKHPALGNFDLFLTPREKDGEFYYEAVFNHI